LLGHHDVAHERHFQPLVVVARKEIAKQVQIKVRVGEHLQHQNGPLRVRLGLVLVAHVVAQASRQLQRRVDAHHRRGQDPVPAVEYVDVGWPVDLKAALELFPCAENCAHALVQLGRTRHQRPHCARKRAKRRLDEPAQSATRLRKAVLEQKNAPQLENGHVVVLEVRLLGERLVDAQQRVEARKVVARQQPLATIGRVAPVGAQLGAVLVAVRAHARERLDAPARRVGLLVCHAAQREVGEAAIGVERRRARQANLRRNVGKRRVERVLGWPAFMPRFAAGKKRQHGHDAGRS